MTQLFIYDKLQPAVYWIYNLGEMGVLAASQKNTNGWTKPFRNNDTLYRGAARIPLSWQINVMSAERTLAQDNDWD